MVRGMANIKRILGTVFVILGPMTLIIGLVLWYIVYSVRWHGPPNLQLEGLTYIIILIGLGILIVGIVLRILGGKKDHVIKNFGKLVLAVGILITLGGIPGFILYIWSNFTLDNWPTFIMFIGIAVLVVGIVLLALAGKKEKREND